MNPHPEAGIRVGASLVTRNFGIGVILPGFRFGPWSRGPTVRESRVPLLAFSPRLLMSGCQDGEVRIHQAVIPAHAKIQQVAAAEGPLTRMAGDHLAVTTASRRVPGSLGASRPHFSLQAQHRGHLEKRRGRAPAGSRDAVARGRPLLRTQRRRIARGMKGSAGPALRPCGFSSGACRCPWLAQTPPLGVCDFPDQRQRARRRYTDKDVGGGRGPRRWGLRFPEGIPPNARFNLAGPYEESTYLARSKISSLTTANRPERSPSRASPDCYACSPFSPGVSSRCKH